MSAKGPHLVAQNVQNKTPAATTKQQQKETHFNYTYAA